MSELTWRTPTLDDLEAITAVVNASERHDRRPEITPPDEVRRELSDADVDTVVVEADGEIVGYGAVVRPPEPGREHHFATLFAYVHPDWRYEVGDRVVERMADAGEAFLAAQTHDRTTMLRTSAMEWQSEDLERLERLGFVRNRVTTVMSIDLTDGAPTAPDVQDVEVQAWDADAVEGARLAHNAAFLDHFGSSPSSPHDWRGRTVDNEHFRPDLSATARVGDEVVGYLLAHRYPEDDEVLGRSEAWISTLGVLPEWRGRGIASSLLVRTLDLVAADPELTHAGLGVDSESLTGANRIYERLGFRPVSRSIMMARSVRRR